MVNKASRAKIRENKHRRLRHHLNGTATTPRLAVFRSNKHMYAHGHCQRTRAGFHEGYAK